MHQPHSSRLTVSQLQNLLAHALLQRDCHGVSRLADYWRRRVEHLERQIADRMGETRSMKPPLSTHRSALKLAPEPFAEDINGWIEFGELPDNELLTAILKNDLHGVIAMAGGFALVRAMLIWLVNYAPIECFGSLGHVDAWRRQAGSERRQVRLERTS